MRAVLHALGVQEEAAFTASFAMAGGLGLTQETCGAITGGAMCLSMLSEKYGRSWDNFNKWGMEQIIDSLLKIGKFAEKCTEMMGGNKCIDLAGMELKNAADVEKYVATPNFEGCCVNCAKVAKLVVETLLDEA
ncbi:MAG: C-GCAxxG-C-C family protein [Desulfobacterales bacterium]|jgi:hypothetical protein|nr:C-GCAxxG-C-C family protein [Desulfobacterales bacterium]